MTTPRTPGTLEEQLRALLDEATDAGNLQALVFGTGALNLTQLVQRAAAIGRAAAFEEAACVVEDEDVVRCGYGYMEADDGRGTLNAAARAIRAAAQRSEGG